MARRVYFREIYLYIVCIIAIIIFIIGVISVYDGTVNHIKPVTYMSKASIVSMYSTERYPDLPGDEIERLAEEEFNTALQSEKDRAFKDLLRGVLLIIIAIPLFAFHWRKAQAMWQMNLEEKNSD
jgi:hypothetical protein